MKSLAPTAAPSANFLSLSAKACTSVEKSGIVHVPIGKRSFSAEQLEQNATALIDAVIKAKPAASKGVYLKKIAISTTMGPGIRVEPSSVAGAA